MKLITKKFMITIIAIVLIVLGAVLLAYNYLNPRNKWLSPTGMPNTANVELGTYTTISPQNVASIPVGDFFVIYTSIGMLRGPFFGKDGAAKAVGTAAYTLHTFAVSDKPFTLVETQDEKNFSSGKLVAASFSAREYHKAWEKESNFEWNGKQYKLEVLENENAINDERKMKPLEIRIVGVKNEVSITSKVDKKDSEFVLTADQAEFINKFRGVSVGSSFEALKAKVGAPAADMSPNNIYHTYVYYLPGDTGLLGSIQVQVPYHSDLITSGSIFVKSGEIVVIDEEFKPVSNTPGSLTEAYRLPYAELSVTSKQKQLTYKQILDGGVNDETIIVPLGNAVYAIGYSTWYTLPDARVSTTWSILKDGIMSVDKNAKLACDEESCKGTIAVDGIVKNIDISKIVSDPTDEQLKSLPGFADVVIEQEKGI